MQTNDKKLNLIKEMAEEEHQISNRRDEDIAVCKSSDFITSRHETIAPHRSCKHGTCAIVGYCIREEKINTAAWRSSCPALGQRITPLKLNKSSPATEGRLDDAQQEIMNLHEMKLNLNRGRFPSI
eukprot:766362-Hanusia_phi.AAC.2